MFRQTGDSITATYINTDFVARKNMHICIPKEGGNVLFILALVNSKLMDFYYSILNPEKGEAMAEVKKFHVEILPIPQIPLNEQTPFITHAQKMLDLTRGLNEKRMAFLNYFRGKFALQKITRNLENWHTLDFADFIKELGKQKVLFSSTDEFDFKPLFDREKNVCVELQTQIIKTDSEIDKMVYALYGLSEEEIGVVENLIK
jgi:hypothetical protein